MVYLLLAGAIALEVIGTVALRLSEGFTRPAASVVVVLGYLGAFYLLARVLTAGIPLGVAYGIWAAAGVALVAVIGAVFLGDGLSGVQVGGLVLIIAGVIALEAGGAR
ncbi:MAG: QacE family quaternary ammonium compound efflux SMR transporter [Pseudonocardiaceae bacterium]|nr:QacE family quaternary ammonium compound efflux SMR transporter [Pseudonocardiaceae bacterium]